MGRAKQYCLFLSVLVIYVCLKREKNLTLKTCAPDFSARLMTKLYIKIKGACTISLFDFPKTWQVRLFFFYFYHLKKIRLDVSCESSALQRIHMKYIMSYFLGKTMKKYSRLSSSVA